MSIALWPLRGIGTGRLENTSQNLINTFIKVQATGRNHKMSRGGENNGNGELTRRTPCFIVGLEMLRLPSAVLGGLLGPGGVVVLHL